MNEVLRRVDETMTSVKNDFQDPPSRKSGKKFSSHSNILLYILDHKWRKDKTLRKKKRQDLYATTLFFIILS